MNSSHDLIAHTIARLARAGVAASDSILIAVSGGMDSMALAAVLLECQKQHVFHTLALAHFNHLLRSDSGEDEELVRTFAERNDLPFFTQSADVAEEAKRTRKGIEETARDLRYGFLSSVAQQSAYTCIATAHTANDQIETILMNIMRGAGMRGLSGIPEVRSLGDARLLRPWLNVPRSDIEQYVDQCGIAFRHDFSNDSFDYTRNRVRHIVMPALRSAFPDRDPVQAFGRLATNMSDLQELLERVTSEKLMTLRSGRGLQLSQLQKLSGLELKLILDAWLQPNKPNGLSSEDLSRVTLFLAEERRAIDLANGLRLTLRDGEVIIEPPRSNAFAEIRLTLGASVGLPMGSLKLRREVGNHFGASRNLAYLDADKIDLDQLSIRPWSPGDRIEPLGMKGRTKLISDVLNESQLPVEQRQNYPVVCCHSTPIWVPGVRGSEYAKIGPETTNLLVMEFHPPMS